MQSVQQVLQSESPFKDNIELAKIERIRLQALQQMH
jgi:hypothetical protein